MGSNKFGVALAFCLASCSAAERSSSDSAEVNAAAIGDLQLNAVTESNLSNMSMNAVHGDPNYMGAAQASPGDEDNTTVNDVAPTKPKRPR